MINMMYMMLWVHVFGYIVEINSGSSPVSLRSGTIEFCETQS